jgi:hypothetical protein
MVTPLAVLDAWAGETRPSIADLGGEEVILRDAEAIIASHHLAAVVESLVREWETLIDPEASSGFVVRAASETQRLIDLQDTLDLVLGSDVVLANIGAALSHALLQRATERGSNIEAAIAAASMSAALRLELGGWTQNRLPIATILRGVDEQENELYAGPATRLLSVAYEQWRFSEFKDALRRLEGNPFVTADARHELAMAELVDAVDAVDSDSLIADLKSVAAMFASAGREDSAVFQAALDGVIAFAESRPSEEIAARAERLRESVRKRALGYHGMHAADFPERANVEFEWLRLATLLSTAAEAIHAYETPESAAAQLLDAYLAARTIRVVARSESGAAIPRLIEPVVESALLESAATRAALLRLLDQPRTEDAEAAERLRSALVDVKKKRRTLPERDIQS